MSLLAGYSFLDEVTFAIFAAGVICALLIRSMATGSKRRWTKLLAFLLIAVSTVMYGITDFGHQTQRSITSIKTSGTIINLREVSGGPKSSPVQHFNVDTGTEAGLTDLHIEDPLFFMKGENGEQVDLTFTRETGYVSHLRIIGGLHTGYQFDAPDHRNTTPSVFYIVVGCIIGITGIFQGIVDHNAEPSLAD